MHTHSIRKALLASLLMVAGTLSAAAAPHYGPALKLYKFDECKKSNLVEFELSSTSQLRALKPGTEAKPQYTTRNLARLEILQLDQLLTQLDLYTEYQKQAKIPADAMQTMECRKIDKLDIAVNGVSKTLDGARSRSIKTSQPYLDRMNQLRSKLRELSSR